MILKLLKSHPKYPSNSIFLTFFLQHIEMKQWNQLLMKHENEHTDIKYLSKIEKKKKGVRV